MTILLIAIGGALGSVGRSVLSALVLRATTPAFPYGTFVVNVLGCAAFGVIAGLAQQRMPLSSDQRAFWLIGVMGGFTTFSSYAFEAVVLLRDGQWMSALVSLVGQVVLGVIALWLGLRMVQ